MVVVIVWCGVGGGGIPGKMLHQFLKTPEGCPPGDAESTVV